ncbi:MAG: M56 family metallopeptidase [Bacteroidales bacterium]|nr:M56 family metallopeptidase [Bacteroidales bacterium]
MISLIMYLAKSILIGALLYGSYQLLMRRESYLTFNRFYLLTAVFLMVVLPFLGSFLPAIYIDGEPAAVLPIIQLPEVVITGQRLVTEEQQRLILNWAMMGYFLVSMAMLAGFAFGLLRIYRFYKMSKSARKLDENIFLVQHSGSPFSFMGKIYISHEYEQHPGLKQIIIHENAHIRQKHMLDLILLELLSSIFWFNPFFFLMKKALREVHEYLADREVIRYGIEPLTYQQLLFNEVSGNPQYIIANNFNLLTKKRIVMLLKKSTRLAAYKIWGIIPIVLLAALSITLLQSQGVSAQTTDKQASVAPPATPAPPAKIIAPQDPEKPVPPPSPAKPAKTSKKAATSKTQKPENDVFTVVEDPPSFPGGDDARIKYMVSSIKYPEDARKKGVQGTVYISFIVEEDGSISNVKTIRGIGAGCDEEAYRVVSEMPKWNPGKQRGKFVRVQYNMPIKFTLSNDKHPK